MIELKGKRLKLFLKGGYFYEGICIDEGPLFLTIIDRKTENERMISLGDISNFEVIKEEGKMEETK